MKSVKKIICLLLVVFVFIECAVGSQFGQVYAKKKILSKQQVNKKITAVEQQIQKLRKQKKKEETREKKEKAGSTYLYAEVVCDNPYILHDTLSNGYFWVNDYRYLDNLWIAAIGYVKLTGNYRTYNGITCAECNSVKVVNKSSGIAAKINTKKKELKKYKNALKEKALLHNEKIKVGKKAKITRVWNYGGAYNTLTWKSSNKKVATVDANGKVTAIKEGTAIITARASVSGIVSKCKVTVWKEDKTKQDSYLGEDYEEDTDIGEDYEETDPDISGDYEETETDTDIEGGIKESKMYFTQDKYYLEDSKTETLDLHVELKEGDDFGELHVDSSNEDVAVFDNLRELSGNRFEVSFILKGAGTTTITVSADNGLTAQCTLTHYIDIG